MCKDKVLKLRLQEAAEKDVQVVIVFCCLLLMHGAQDVSTLSLTPAAQRASRYPSLIDLMCLVLLVMTL
jgi:hypothetical protein